MFQFMVQRKKQEAEERRNKLKKAREDYKKMLEVSVCCFWKFLLNLLTDAIYFLSYIHFGYFF